ncbi:hypothetical protein [Paenibacillus medicaginis]|uniref:LLM class flavin-dependent oxidoreductase n=1 Tax=Paenibacillus medicaginis TaxID=1470560 RepID=A0ABV5C7Y9_9BACL
MNIYSQTPHAAGIDNYYDHIIELSQLSEKYDYKGILITYSTSNVNPWLISSLILDKTKKIRPLVAVQPDSLPVDTLVNILKSSMYLYNREISLNLIDGTSKRLKGSMEASHKNDRYEWLIKFMEETRRVLSISISDYDHGLYNQKVCFSNENNYPIDFFMSGTSKNAFETAKSGADGFLTVPGPIHSFKKTFSPIENCDFGVCFGIIARPTSDEAWRVAKETFPHSRENDIQLLLKRNSKMNAVRGLADLALEQEVYDDVYWLGVFKNGKNIYPYLVGSYNQVADYLKEYKRHGVRSLILNTPFSREEFRHREQVFKRI